MHESQIWKHGWNPRWIPFNLSPIDFLWVGKWPFNSDFRSPSLIDGDKIPILSVTYTLETPPQRQGWIRSWELQSCEKEKKSSEGFLEIFLFTSMSVELEHWSGKHSTWEEFIRDKKDRKNFALSTFLPVRVQYFEFLLPPLDLFCGVEICSWLTFFAWRKTRL